MSYSLENYYFTVQEVAAILKLSVLTIYKYIRNRELTVIQIGGHYRIPKSSLSSFVKSRQVKRITNDPYEK